MERLTYAAAPVKGRSGLPEDGQKKMIGECLSDRYEVLAELGRGGMGVVYRAHDPFLERDVAIKVISLAQITPEAEERFRREARLVAKMDHPGIVPIYDLGTHRDYLFFVMPVVEGVTLETRIRRHSWCSKTPWRS